MRQGSVGAALPETHRDGFDVGRPHAECEHRHRRLDTRQNRHHFIFGKQTINLVPCKGKQLPRVALAGDTTIPCNDGLAVSLSDWRAPDG